MPGTSKKSVRKPNATDSQILWASAVVEASMDGVIMFGESGNIEYANAGVCAMFGYPVGTLPGRHWTSLLVLRDAEYAQQTIKRCAEGKAELIGRRQDGSTFPVEVSLKEIEIDGRHFFTAMFHDISLRRRTEEEKDQLVQNLNKRNIEITCLYKIDESIRSREALSAIFEDVTALLPSAFLYSDIASARVMFDNDVYAAAPFEVTPWRLAKFIMVTGRPRGILEVFYSESRPERDDGPFLKEESDLLDAIAHILGETVERREAQARVIHASKLASIGELAAGVGHEINNPVNGILNCADILLRRITEDGDARQFVEYIHCEAERIAGIVRNLLTFSRQDRRDYLLARPCDIVDAVLSLSRTKIVKSNVELRIDVPQDLPELRCRSEQLQQVIMNLIINSLHALDERYPQSHSNKILSIIGRTIEFRGRRFVRLTVEDRGVGIEPTHMDRLFEPFFTTKGRDKGTGLGLSVSEGIVRSHRGTISAESELNKFTRFHVDIPLENELAPLQDPITEQET